MSPPLDLRISAKLHKTVSYLLVACHQLYSTDVPKQGLPFLTFGGLSSRSKRAAKVLSKELHGCVEENQPATIGLICSSSLEFVLTWLGLMRLGYTALLLA